MFLKTGLVCNKKDRRYDFQVDSEINERANMIFNKFKTTLEQINQ